MSVSFGGIGEVFATFENEDGLEIGAAVKMSGNGKVAACADGERFCGIAHSVAADGHARIQVRGYCRSKYTGTAPTVGFGSLVSDGAGAVKTGADGGEFLISDVDTVDAIVGFWM